jgi:lambda repressor-like predicted transcriptional regulator
LGRPRVLVDSEKVADLRREGFSLREIALTLGVSKDTIVRVCASSSGQRLIGNNNL